jgi:hypothetical protein
LHCPVPVDAGAHGRFDAEARRSSAQHLANTHRWTLAAAAAPVLLYLGSKLLAGRK